MKKGQTLYNVFIGYLIKKGNKIQAKRILDVAFFELSRKFNLPSIVLLRKIVRKMGSNIEIKTIKMRKNTHVVPFAINQHRKNYLLVKKIMDTVKEDTTNRPITDKLIEELTGILLSTKANKSLQKNKVLLKQAVLNRSNVHFRW
jgi:ribosomal protein S7